MLVPLCGDEKAFEERLQCCLGSMESPTMESLRRLFMAYKGETTRESQLSLLSQSQVFTTTVKNLRARADTRKGEELPNSPKKTNHTAKGEDLQALADLAGTDLLVYKRVPVNGKVTDDVVRVTSSIARPSPTLEPLRLRYHRSVESCGSENFPNHVSPQLPWGTYPNLEKTCTEDVPLRWSPNAASLLASFSAGGEGDGQPRRSIRKRPEGWRKWGTYHVFLL